MGLAGKFICSFTGTDCTGGFDLSLDAIVQGLGYASPPIMALLFIMDVGYNWISVDFTIGLFKYQFLNYQYILSIYVLDLIFFFFSSKFQDEVVKLSPHARAIRDVEDEELRNFFYGMSPWQVKILTLHKYQCCFHALHQHVFILCREIGT